MVTVKREQPLADNIYTNRAKQPGIKDVMRKWRSGELYGHKIDRKDCRLIRSGVP